MAIAGEFGLDLTPEGTAALSMLDVLNGSWRCSRLFF